MHTNPEVEMSNEILELRGCLFPCTACGGSGIDKECGDLNCTWICPKCLGFSVSQTRAKLFTKHQAAQMNNMIDKAVAVAHG